EEAATRRCGQCGAVAYCSTSHQVSHCNEHKEECERLEQQMRRVDVLHDFPFTFSKEATVQICEKRRSRSFLMDRSLHKVGMWKYECNCLGPSSSCYSRLVNNSYRSVYSHGFVHLMFTSMVSQPYSHMLPSVIAPGTSVGSMKEDVRVQFGMFSKRMCYHQTGTTDSIVAFQRRATQQESRKTFSKLIFLFAVFIRLHPRPANDAEYLHGILESIACIEVKTSFVLNSCFSIATNN
ncbi:hypothetical protein IFM89_020324, partial [Coptis chinensis]